MSQAALKYTWLNFLQTAHVQTIIEIVQVKPGHFFRVETALNCIELLYLVITGVTNCRGKGIWLH